MCEYINAWNHRHYLLALAGFFCLKIKHPMSCNKPRTFSKTLPPKNMRHKDLQNANAFGLTGYCKGGGMSVLMSGNRSTTTDLGTQHPRKPSTPANRSKPDSFTPPNGSDWAMYVEQKSLTEVMPASNCWPSFSARFCSRQKRLNLNQSRNRSLIEQLLRRI